MFPRNFTLSKIFRGLLLGGLLPLFAASLSAAAVPVLSSLSGIGGTDTSGPNLNVVLKVQGPSMPSGSAAGNITVRMTPLAPPLGTGGAAIDVQAATYQASATAFGTITFYVPDNLQFTTEKQYNVSIIANGVPSSNSLLLKIRPVTFTISPATAQIGQKSLTINITGTNTRFGVGSLTYANFGPGVSVGGAPPNTPGLITVTSPTSATAVVDIDFAAATGARSLVITGPDTVQGLNNLTVTTPTALTLVSATPDYGSTGAVLTIGHSGVTGPYNPTGFTVIFTPVGGGTSILATSTAVSGSTITVAVPPGLTPGSPTKDYVISVYGNNQAGESYQSSNTVPFTYTPAPTISVSPNSAVQGTTLNVAITGQYTHFASGLSGVSFGAGISVNSVSVTNANALTANITVAPGAAVGLRDASVTTGTETVSLTNAFTVLGVPSIISTFPPSGAQGTTRDMVIAGANTHFVQGTTTLNFGAGITVNSVTVTGPTTLLVNVTISSGAAAGARTYSVTTGSETESGTYTVLSPSLTSVSPATGQPGQTLNVTITGHDTSFVPGVSTVSFGPGVTANSVTVTNSTTLTANISISSSAAAGTRTVSVTTGSEVVSLPNGFTVNGAPAIASVSPPSGTRGNSYTMTITGTNTNFVQGTTTVNLGSGITVGTVTVVSPTQLTVSVSIDSSASAGSRNVTVTTGAETATLSNGFTVGVTSWLTCTTSTGVPTVIRAEGHTEKVGDFLLTCTGGQPGVTQNVDLSLFLNTNVTSRITSGNVTEATLIVDELASGPSATPAVYHAEVSASNQLVWKNVALTPPGTTGSRTLRLTNIRANAAGLGVSNTLIPTQVVAFLSVGSGMAINNPQQTLAYIKQGMSFDVRDCAGGSPTGQLAFQQCTGQNDGGSGSDLVHGSTGKMQFSVHFREGFQTAFQKQIDPAQAPSTPGIAYNTESGFVETSSSLAVGGADSGTRLVARFRNIPAGVRLFVTTGQSYGTSPTLAAKLIQTDANGAGGIVTPGIPSVLSTIPGTVQLSCPNAVGAAIAGAEVPITNGSGMAVWEITGSDSASIEDAFFGVAVVYPPDVSNNQPGLGQSSVSGGFGPFYAPGSGADQSSATLPVPRFVDHPISADTFKIDSCGTSVSPNTGSRSQSLVVTITGTGTHFAQGVTSIDFGAGITAGAITVVSPTQFTVPITIDDGADLGSRNVTIMTGSEVISIPNGFSVLPVSSGAFTCTANSGVPPLLRAEGYTEQVGDLVLVCTGGTAGAVRTFNLQLFLNTNITSRVVSGNTTEASLIVDELASGGGSTPAFYQAEKAQGENSIVWPNVSITEPGSGQRTLRITNLRANAAGLGASTTLIPTQVVALLSASPSQSLPLNNPQQTVGYVQPGLSFDVRDCAGGDLGGKGAFEQCVGRNNGGSGGDLINGSNGTMQFSVRFREGFQTAFRKQLAGFSQIPSVPGVTYNSETGFVRSTADLLAGVGSADAGTRLVAQFTNIPAGARVFVTIGASYGSSPNFFARLVAFNANGAAERMQRGVIPVVSPTPATAQLSCPLTTAGSVPAAEIPVTNGAASAVWEVTDADPAQLENAVFGVAIVYAPDVANQSPGLGQSSVLGSFGPFYAAGSGADKMSATLPIPRFTAATTATPTFTINSCMTSLLFPFVTSQSGFDTGIAIANSSKDPFANPSARLQSGKCTINFYGSTHDGGAAPASQTTSDSVKPGEVLTFVVSSGGNLGITGVPGFQGYIIAQCNFQYAHGFAFLTDGPIGAARVAEGYLALVLDSATPSRGAQTETLGN